jgi:hypothetical protein
MSATESRASNAILWGGLLAGALDLFFAFAYYGPKLGVMQSVAGGLMGRKAALEGGIPTFLLGLALHFLVACIWAALFWLASRRFHALVRHAIPAGLLYGLVIYYGMNCIVLPLSALHTKAWPPPFAPWPVAAHVLLVGLPIAWIARRHTPRLGNPGEGNR